MEVELGRVNSPLHFQWRQGPTGTPVVRFREAYLWNLQPEVATLTALVQYTVSAGATSSLALDLPVELEVRQVEARRPARAAPESRPAERDTSGHRDAEVEHASQQRGGQTAQEQTWSAVTETDRRLARCVQDRGHRRHQPAQHPHRQ